MRGLGDGAMTKLDDAEIIRNLAYQIWEREGRPSGREHEHWAEANRLHAARHPRSEPKRVNELPRWNRTTAERQEIEALRAALWTPEPFSHELFGGRPAAPREPAQRVARLQ